MPRNLSIASGESRERKPAGWDESMVGAVGNDVPVDAHEAKMSFRHNGQMPIDSICRTAGYVTRTSGGVGGGSREAFPYPDWASHTLDSFHKYAYARENT